MQSSSVEAQKRKRKAGSGSALNQVDFSKFLSLFSDLNVFWQEEGAFNYFLKHELSRAQLMCK